jgi:hypothetical protein
MLPSSGLENKPSKRKFERENKFCWFLPLLGLFFNPENESKHVPPKCMDFQ